MSDKPRRRIHERWDDDSRWIASHMSKPSSDEEPTDEDISHADNVLNDVIKKFKDVSE